MYNGVYFENVKQDVNTIVYVNIALKEEKKWYVFARFDV